MSNEPEIVGDKLRKAIFIVWLSNKFEKGISRAELRRLSGYKSSGLYSAKEEGWFTENDKGKLGLAPEAELYLEKNLISPHKIIKLLLSYLLLFISLLIIQEFLVLKYEMLLRFNIFGSTIAAIILILIIVFWYRIFWFLEKRSIRSHMS